MRAIEVESQPSSDWHRGFPICGKPAVILLTHFGGKTTAGANSFEQSTHCQPATTKPVVGRNRRGAAGFTTPASYPS